MTQLKPVIITTTYNIRNTQTDLLYYFMTKNKKENLGDMIYIIVMYNIIMLYYFMTKI